MNIDKALLRLLRKADWQHFFQACCQDGVVRLEAQAWQFQEELCERQGRKNYIITDVQDALFDLARELMPETPAATQAAFENWAGSLLRQMFNFLYAHGLEGPDGEDADTIDEAYATGARATLRAAARGYTKKAIEREAA